MVDRDNPVLIGTERQLIHLVGDGKVSEMFALRLKISKKMLRKIITEAYRNGWEQGWDHCNDEWKLKMHDEKMEREFSDR